MMSVYAGEMTLEYYLRYDEFVVILKEVLCAQQSLILSLFMFVKYFPPENEFG